ncbi:MAG: pirin family protein [Bacteroidales bacterium]|nr:pirin family protein [Bacteroidales bacterium]
METRKAKRILMSKPTMEGAGVHLKRVFGYYDVPMFDPFLMMDDFRNDDPQKYLRGFPWHPHRGIETITYMLDGSVEHRDSLGNTGVLSGGDVQWMTAGRGIVHQEMPRGNAEGKMLGFQLWANLPASHKMMSPRYQDIPSQQIPEIVTDNGTRVRILCGSVNGVQGPVKDIIIDPEYLDVTVPANSEYLHPTHRDYTVFLYTIGGNGYTGAENETALSNETVVLFEDGDQVRIATEGDPVRFLLISGKPIREPVAWGGPIVMNTREEVQQAFREYEEGSFLK